MPPGLIITQLHRQSVLDFWVPHLSRVRTSV